MKDKLPKMKDGRIKFGPDSRGAGWDPKFNVDEDMGYRYDRALYLLNQGYYREALPIARGLETKLPEHPYIINLVGIIMAQLDRDMGALLKFEKALHYTPKDSLGLLTNIWTNIGAAKMKLNKIGECEDALRKAIEYDNTNSTAFANLGLIKYNKKEYYEAIPFFEAVLDLETESSRPSNTLAGTVLQLCKCYAETGQEEKAKEMFEKTKKLPPAHAYIFLEHIKQMIFYNRDLDPNT